MTAQINKIKLRNFKRFKEIEIKFDAKLNLLIGDNEAGKSSILLAINIVLSGSNYKVETIGLERLFNTNVIEDFLKSDKNIENLPKLFIEVYLNEQDNFHINGKYNSDTIACDGLLFECFYDEELSDEIREILSQDNLCFPFEYYISSFKTFSGKSYTGYKKFLRHISIDNTQISNEYAVKDYIKSSYVAIVDGAKQNEYEHKYRQHKITFENDVLNELNDSTQEYKFKIQTNSKANLSTDLTISEGNINIENKGKGRQCFIKTEFALRKNKNREIDVVLIEEPENHLSHTNIKKIIDKISESNSQIFVATHNSLISTRLDLRRTIFLNSNSQKVAKLDNLSAETANFFMKAPDNNILEFILSEKVILVEGYAEFILMDAFFKSTAERELSNSGIHIISVGGLSFKRYLELAKLLNIKTAVVRDNDGAFQTKCVDNYSEYIDEGRRIFYSNDNNEYTFEIAIYNNNNEICDGLFGENAREYMLKNKANAAFMLLDKENDNVTVPNYIKEAIEWINE